MPTFLIAYFEHLTDIINGTIITCHIKKATTKMSKTIKLITISPIQCKQITQRNDCIEQQSKGKRIDPHNAGYHW